MENRKDWYLGHNLIIEQDKIYYNQPVFIMMDWEHPLMSASATYICEGGGDILEIGFGMGISAGYIQSHSISSHTIIENHPQIIPLAQEWAKDKPNVIIISGSWSDVFEAKKLSTYDGLFFDIWNTTSHHQPFSSSLSSLMKPGGKATWWNSAQVEGSNQYNIPDVEYDILDTPNYTDKILQATHPHPKYYLPKKQF